MAISEACAVDECDARVSRWWLLRVVRVLDSSVMLLVLPEHGFWESDFSERYQLLELVGRVLAEELQEIHLCVKLQAYQGGC